MAVKITQRSTGKTWTSGAKETEQEQPKQEQVESVQSTPSDTAEEPKRQWSSKSGKTVIRQVKWIDEQPVKSTNSQAGASNASAGAVRMEDEKEEMRRQQILGRQSEDLQKQIDALTQQEEERHKNTSLWEKIGRAISPIRSFRQEENDAEDAISKLQERKAEVDRQYQMDANQYMVYQTYQKSERPEQYTAENVGNYKQRLAALASVYGTWTKEQEQEAKEAIGTQSGGTGLLSSEKNVWAFAPYQEAVRKNDTESARQWEQIYNALYTRLYSEQEAVTSGLMQGLGFEALGDVVSSSPKMTDEARERWTEQKQNYAYAQSEHPYLASGARVAGSLALMSGVGEAAGAGLAATGLKTGSFWFNVARGSLTFAGVNAIQNSGALATGNISGGDYLKSIAVSGAQGAAGNIAGELVGSGLANVLRKNGLMTPFFEFVRQTASGMSNATVNQAIGYAAADKKPTKQEIAEGLVTSFLFSALSSAISTYETTSAQKARMQQAYNQIESSYQAMAAGTENMTPEAKAQRVQLILQQTQSLRAATGEYYIAGQQKAVNNLNSALDAIEDWANNYLNGYQAATMQTTTALPGGTTGQIPSATAQPPVDPNLTQEVANGLQTAITQGVIQADTPQPMTGGDAAAGAAQSVSQNLQAQGLDAKTADALVRAATEMQQEAMPTPSGGQSAVPTETVAPKQNTVQTPAQGATQREAFKEVTKSSSAPKQETQKTTSATKTQTETGAASMEPIAKTLGENGQRAIFKAYDGKTDTAEYAGEFVKAYNAARAGNDLPETRTLEPWQKYAAEVAGKNDMEPEATQESTIVNTDPAEHTKAEQAVIEAYKASADGKMRGFIEKVRSLQNNDYKNKISADVHTETTRAADTAGELTGTDTSGFKNIIKGNAIQHIDRRHGANGSADHSMENIDDFSRIGFVLDHFTDAELLPLNRVDAETAKLSREWMNSDNTQAPLVRFSMPVNGVFYVVEAVASSKAKRLAVVSAYISGEHKGSTLKQVLNLSDTTGSGTPETPLAILDAPEKSLAQNGGAVKQTGANTLDAAGVDRLVQHAAENTADHSAEWTATRVGDKKQKPKPLSEIIAGIEHDFGINITTGHARGRVRGQYSRLDNGIRTKITNDLPTVSHELGHALDREYGITGNLSDTMRGELEKSLGDLKSAYKENEWVSEGFAEYLRKYLQNSETAAIDYPEFTKHFLNSLSPRDRALVENLADEVNAYYSLDADTAQSAIRLREERVPTGDTTGDKLRAEASVLYQAWVDSLHGIKRLDEATGTNTYRLATNAAYSDAMAGQIITGNLTDANGQYVGPGLKAALHGINLKNKAEYQAFGEYLVVRHGPERLKDGMRVFADDRKNSTVFMNRRVAELEKQYPEFHNAAERLYRFQDQLKETWLVGTGLISEETSKAWNERWKYYVPFNRAVPQGQGGAKRGFANQQNPIKRARGSGRELVHPVDNIISNVVKVVNAGVRNNVMRRITDEAQRVGADAVFLEKIPTPMRGTRVDLTGVKRDLKDQIAGKDWDNAKDFEEIVADIDDYMTQFQSGKAFGDVVTVRKNGKPEFWKVNDPLLLQSITEMSPSKVGGIVDAIGKVSHFMTSNITGDNIIWSIFSNLPRDLGTLMVYAKEPNRFKLLKEIAMSYANKIKGDSANPLYLEYLAMGGGKASYYSTDRDVAKKARKDIVGGITLNPLDWMSYLGDMIEQGPRFATYKCLRDRGADPQTAFYEAMDVTTNFRRGGRTSRQINKFIPFFNAGVQGADKHVRFLTGQDAPPEQRKRVVRNRMITYFAASAGIAALFYLINNRDEESKKNYQQLSTYTKNSYFCIPIGDGKYFAVAKPRDLAVLTSAMESGLELGVGGNKHAFDGFWSYAASNYLPNVASDLAQGDWKGALGGLGIIGIGTSMVANRDFLGRPIESAGMQYLEPKDRYNDRTSKLAYWAGQAFNVSPQMTDYFFNNVLGGWWKYQKALFPVGEENRDWTLGVKNTYVKDNQYSQDLSNWLYDKADKSSQASKSNPDDFSKKITAKTDSNMISFYGNYNKLSKNDTKSTAARVTRQLVLDTIREYQKAADNKSQTDAEKEVYAICEAHGDVDILPGVMQTSIKDADGKEYTLSAADYVEFQTDYLGIYWESVSQALDGVKGDAQRYSVLKSVKDAAKEQAKVRALKRLGAKTTTAWGDKYSSANTYDVAYFKANADADGNGSISQAEAEALLRKMDLTNAERADLWAATNKAWAEKNNPFR